MKVKNKMPFPIPTKLVSYIRRSIRQSKALGESADEGGYYGVDLINLDESVLPAKFLYAKFGKGGLEISNIQWAS